MSIDCDSMPWNAALLSSSKNPYDAAPEFSHLVFPAEFSKSKWRPPRAIRGCSCALETELSRPRVCFKSKSACALRSRMMGTAFCAGERHPPKDSKTATDWSIAFCAARFRGWLG
ncbi:hypothetical protein RRF57_008598 [Xylaria bambusicola]|uniref:Uncharacterized protein n=1 Tax=Xylaria bambusicola TaxID=326684 RepID=A0AAN7Z0U8_9PEZI